MTQSSIHDILPAKLFHDRMSAYLDEYADYLMNVKSDTTFISQEVMLRQCINFLFNEHLVKDLNEITPEMLQFSNLLEEEYPDLVSNATSHLILDALRGFFEFLYGKYGVKHEVLSQWLKNSTEAARESDLNSY